MKEQYGIEETQIQLYEELTSPSIVYGIGENVVEGESFLHTELRSILVFIIMGKGFIIFLWLFLQRYGQYFNDCIHPHALFFTFCLFLVDFFKMKFFYSIPLNLRVLRVHAFFFVEILEMNGKTKGMGVYIIKNPAKVLCMSQKIT